MSLKRRYRLSQMIHFLELGDGTTVPVYYVEDLSDDELQAQFEHYLDREDYEYLAHLKVEADRRGLILKTKTKEVKHGHQ